jgi:hypothetical protein
MKNEFVVWKVVVRRNGKIVEFPGLSALDVGELGQTLSKLGLPLEVWPVGYTDWPSRAALPAPDELRQMLA